MKCGYTDECQACKQLAAGMHNAKVLHDDRCRDRFGKIVAEDDDHRQGERVSSSRAVPEVEVPRAAAGEEMDVSAPTVRVDVPTARPTPTYPKGGSRFRFESKRNEHRRALFETCDVRRKPVPEEARRRFWRPTRKDNISTLTMRCVPTKLTGLKMPQRMRQPQRQNRYRHAMNSFASSKIEVRED